MNKVIDTCHYIGQHVMEVMANDLFTTNFLSIEFHGTAKKLPI